MQSINTTPITQFLHIVKAGELGQQREIKIPIQQARMITIALSEMLDKLNRDYESMYNSLKSSTDTEQIAVTMDGGGFEESRK